MSRSSHLRAVLPALSVPVVAELAARLLEPRPPVGPPASVDLREHFSPEEITRGRRYMRGQLALGLAGDAVQAGVLVAAARSLALRRGSLPGVVRPGGAGAGVAAGLVLATTVAGLPLRALQRRRALSAGLVTQPWRDWGQDILKATTISVGLAAGAGAAAVHVAHRDPRSWWLWMAGGGIGGGALLAGAGPLLLDPLFNDFTSLEASPTRGDVLELAQRAGVKVGRLLSVDASRRTTAANAYVSGLGPSKRVVLFDTLLDRYTRDEIRVVVAHELAHVRGRDVPRGLLFVAVVAGPLALAVQRVAECLDASPIHASALPTVMLATGVLAAPVGLIGNRLSRALERRADAFSLELTGSPQAFIEFERRIALQNLADLDPPRWLTALFSTHPPTAERIGAAVRFAEQAGG